MMQADGDFLSRQADMACDASAGSELMAAGRTALVLAGGGSLGAVQAGMLRELVADGVRPDLVIGVSAGALNGAFFASDPTLANVDRMLDLWCRVTTREILGLSWRSLLGLVGLADHLADARGLRALLQRELRHARFDQLQLPLHAVCADLESGDGVVLSEGSLVDAVLASTAIPGVFPAVQVGGRALVDGAVAQETPIAVAMRLGVARLIVLPCGFACAGTAVPRHALGRAMHAITLLGARQLRQDYDRYATAAQIHIVPPLCPLRQSAYDYSRGAELIRRSREGTAAWLSAGGLGSTVFPGALVPHRH
jgi:NTE family protein